MWTDDHFEKAHRQDHWWATFLRTLGFVAALGGWFLAISLLMPAKEANHAEVVGAETARAGERRMEVEAHHPGGPAYPSHEILIISSLLVISGGLLIAYSERQGHEELARQYERMDVVFRNGDKGLVERLSKQDIPGAQRIIEELGREAITEHAGWYMLRHSRSLELHIG